MWKSIGKFASNHLSIRSIQDFGMCKQSDISNQPFIFHLEPIYFTVSLIKRSPVTHDTDWYTFSLPSNIFMSPPIGYHIRLRCLKDGYITYFFLFIDYLIIILFRCIDCKTLYSSK